MARLSPRAYTEFVDPDAITEEFVLDSMQTIAQALLEPKKS